MTLDIFIIIIIIIVVTFVIFYHLPFLYTFYIYKKKFAFVFQKQ